MSIGEKFTAGEMRELEEIFFATLRKHYVVLDKTRVHFFVGGAIVFFLTAGIAGWFEAKRVAAKAVADVAGKETVTLINDAKAKARQLLDMNELGISEIRAERIKITKNIGGTETVVVELTSDALGGLIEVRNNDGVTTSLIHHSRDDDKAYGGSINVMNQKGVFRKAMHVNKNDAGEVVP